MISMQRYPNLVGAILVLCVALATTATAEEKTRDIPIPAVGEEPIVGTEIPEVEKRGFFGTSFDQTLLELGVEEKFEVIERSLIKAQIKSFIPPLLQATVTNDAFILPPNTFQMAANFGFTNMSGQDDFSGIDNSFNGIRQQFANLRITYGFDLNQKFLHSFTAGINIPYQNYSIRGSSRLQTPGGPVELNDTGSSEGLGDISLFVKKKIFDQANHLVGLAVDAGIFIPTGSNDERFGNNGRITVTQPDGTTTNPVLQRFSDDGRLPAILQPGTGKPAYRLGAAITRQFLPGDIPLLGGTGLDRGAVHIGGFHKFTVEDEGIDPGDRSVAFLSVVGPLYKDFLSLDISNIYIVQQADSYAGTFLSPGASLPVAREPFTKGWTSLLGPTLIFSPDPLIRMTATGLFRVHDPELGPSPPFVVNFGATIIF